MSAKGYWRQDSHNDISDSKVRDYCVLKVSEDGQQIQNEVK